MDLFLVVLRLHLCFHFSEFIFPYCYKDSISYGLKKLNPETLRISPWVIHWKLQTIWKRGRVEFFTEVVEFSLEKEKALQFCICSHLASVIESWNAKTSIWNLFLVSAESKKQDDKRPLKNHWLSNPFLNPLWAVVSVSLLPFLTHECIRKPTAPPDPRCLWPGPDFLRKENKSLCFNYKPFFLPFFFSCFSSLEHWFF